MKIKQVRLVDSIDKKLNKIVESRKESGNLVYTKQGIIAEYVIKGFKREVITKVPYGHCPICGARSVSRERRMNGNDKCSNGCTYPSSTAINI